MIEVGYRRQGWTRLFALAMFLTGMLLGGMPPWSAQGVPQGGYAHPQVLIQAEELKALLDQKTQNLKIIDVRHKAKYYLGHIPGAVQVWRPALEDRKQAVAGKVPGAAQLESVLGRLGVSHRDTLVIYSDLCDHTRLWWLLAYYGFPLERMRLLDGGLEAWKAQGYPTQLTSPHLKRATFKLPADSQRKSLLATLEEVKEARGNPQKVILETRSSERQRLGGETRESAARRGRIPEAVWVPWTEARVADGPHKGFWKSAGDLQALYTARGVTPDKDIYLYSPQGREAASALLSLYLAGYPLEKLHVYPGSWTE